MFQKLTIDWPCALGDWLWVVLVMAPARFLDRLTWRSASRLAIYLGMLWFLIYLLKEMPFLVTSLDMSFLFTLDATLYWEAGAMLMLLTARGLSRQMLGTATRFIVQTVRARLPRFTRRARRTRRPVRHIPDRGEDEGGLAWTFTGAGAFV